MTTVYLPDVVEDYSFNDGFEHKYACSGIDGISFGPGFGNGKDSKQMLYVAYGIYGDVNREDNDCVVKTGTSSTRETPTGESRISNTTNPPEIIS